LSEGLGGEQQRNGDEKSGVHAEVLEQRLGHDPSNARRFTSAQTTSGTHATSRYRKVRRTRPKPRSGISRAALCAS
jgi:hypothetical protein